MREQLTKYVELLFAGTTDTDDIQQEILQNTLDRYDDLIQQGKAPQAAYRLAISGIGDINEILGQSRRQDTESSAGISTPEISTSPAQPESHSTKLLRSIAIALYILCAIPVIFFEEIGLCITLIMVAVATAILVFIGKDDKQEAEEVPAAPQATSNGRKLSNSIIGLVGLAVYLILSFLTKGWYITWLIFPMMGCVKGIVRGIFDLKEACDQ